MGFKAPSPQLRLMNNFSGMSPVVVPAMDSSDSRAVAALKVAMKYRLAMVQASAGWGKTTLVRQVVGDRSHLWVDLSTAPRESGAFVFALALALGISTSALGRVLQDARTLNSAQPVIEWFQSHRPRLDLLVVDDLHLMAADQVSLDVIVALVKTAPHVRWIFMSRYAVRLPIASWIAYGEASLSVGEDQLKLDDSSIRVLLKSASLRVDDVFVSAFGKITGGWPVAAQFFLRAAERTGDLAQISHATKEVAFSYLSDQVTSDLPADRLELLRLCAFAGTSKVDFLSALGRVDPESDVAWLRGAPVPLVQSSDDLILHDLFSEYIRRTTPPSERRLFVDKIIDVLLERGKIGESVDVARVHAQDRLLEILGTRGFSLLDEGRWETASQALMLISSESRQSNAGIIGLRAALESSSGAFDRAQGLYERAIDLAEDMDLRSTLASRLSRMHLNRADAGARSVIEPVLEIGGVRARCEARGVYAVALAVTGNAAAAVTELQSALVIAEDLADDGLVAKMLKDLAWAYFHLGDALLSDRNAMEAARLSESVGDWNTYTSAHSMLCASASFYHDDTSRALWHAQQVVSGATRAGDRQKRSYGLWGQYEIEVDRGRRDRVESIERDIDVDSHAYRAGFLSRFSQAVRLGWNGAFSEGVKKLESLNGQIPNQSEARCWRASLACFQAFAGDESSSKTSISLAGRRRPSTNAADLAYEVVADLYVSLAEIFSGRSAVAARHIPSDCSRSQDVALAECLRLLTSQTSLNPSSASSALGVLRSAGRDGFADLLLEALRNRPDDVRPSSLTEAETAVLRGLSSGRSAKQIAEATDRSYETIRNQIKSACRKLGVSSQIEALAAARRLGVI